MVQSDWTRDRNVGVVRVKINASNSKADTSLPIMTTTYIRIKCDITPIRC